MKDNDCTELNVKCKDNTGFVCEELKLFDPLKHLT